MRTKTLEQNTAQDFAGLQVDLLQKLRSGNMTFEQMKWFSNLSFEQREQLMGKQPEKSAILKLISGGELLKLDPVSGNETIAKSKGMFSYIDSDFKNWGANAAGAATAESAVAVYEMVKNARFAEMFPTLNTDLDKLCLTQHQIMNFIQKHRNWLRTDGYATFFLFKSNDQFFVARVSFVGDGLRVSVNRFEDDNVCYAGLRHRVVVPQLAV